jgi:ferredoxin-NADP reductase
LLQLLLRVRSNRRATPSTRIIQVDLGDVAFSFEAGQWAQLGNTDASGQFSIACSPQESGQGRMLEFLVRDEGSGRALVSLHRGASLNVEGPHGRFKLPPALDEEVLFVAGGTGIAPLRSMLMDLLARRQHPRCTLIYSARSSLEFAYAPELRRLAREGRLALAFTVTRGAAPRWKGSIGRLDRRLLERLRPSAATQAFVCGPPGFVGDVRAALEALAVDKIRSEEQ